MSESFADRLRIAITDSGLRKTDVAAIACSDGPHLCRILADRSAPSLETLRRLLEAMPRTDARWLVCGGKQRWKRK